MSEADGCPIHGLQAADETLKVIERGEEDLLRFDEAVREIEEERKRLREAGELPGESDRS